MPTLLVLCYGGLLACLVGTVIVALWLGNLPALVNAAVATLLAIAPSIVVPLLDGSSAPAPNATPLLSVWISGAALLHTIGMFGPYDTVWWWDHLTHTLSASLLAALLYAVLLVTQPRLAVVGDGPLVVASGTMLCTLALGIVWEFVELAAREIGEHRDIDAVLEYYGLRDTALDLAFDALGAVAVIALDLQVFVPVIERNPPLAGAALTTTVVSGFLAVAGITVWLERRHPDGGLE